MPEELPSKINVKYAQTSIEGGKSDRDAQYYADALGLDLKSLEGKSVLDLGAGKDLAFAGDLEERGIHTEKTVSYSPAFAVKRWRNNAKRKGTPEARKQMVAGLGEMLPFKDASFDVITCLNLMQHVTHADALPQILQECIRTLKPGGEAYISPITVRDKYIVWDYVPSTHAKSVSLKIEIEELRLSFPPDVQMILNPRPRLDLGWDTSTLILKKMPGSE